MSEDGASRYSALSGLQCKFGRALPMIDCVCGKVEVLEIQPGRVRARLKTRDASIPLVVRDAALIELLPSVVGGRSMMSVSGRPWVTEGSQIEILVDRLEALPG